MRHARVPPQEDRQLERLALEKDKEPLKTAAPIQSKDEFIVSRIYRMPIYRTFSYIEEYIVSSLQYREYSIHLEKAELS